jgi:hypothetical protein
MIHLRTPYLCLMSLVVLCGPATAASNGKAGLNQAEFFEKSVRPLLAENCFACHGPTKQKGGLRVDSRAALLRGGDSGPAFVPGQPESSRLITAIHYDGDLRMPPKGKLADEKICVLADWIRMGAAWPESAKAVRTVGAERGVRVTEQDRAFWSFQPIKQVAPPAVNNAAWARGSIDRFVLAKMEQQALHPVAAADKRTLLRRATFDLTGLPPTVAEIDAFLNDHSADAFAKVVERLLASPHYGERWARHWLDVARYGEDQAHTFQARKYADGFRYRDWVIHALNKDMPYDRFVMEQIAGDLMQGPERTERLAALGFFALGPVYYGRAVADELDDRVDTLSRGFLGLTVACARCHDHKFDPIPTRDYYALAGVFACTDYKEYVLTSTGEVDDKAVSEPTDKAKAKDKAAPRRAVLHGLTEGSKIANLRVYLRGNPAMLGEEAPRRFLSVLTPEQAPAFKSGSGRLELAQAMASKDNPLTARVMVNRIWMHHFGRGIVATPSNFGATGERPTHPELLDYLARRFSASGWSIKALHRDIMLSATYQLSSGQDARNARIDPDNQLLWRMNRQRLEVEPFRDALLAVAGNLDGKIGGAPVDLSAEGNGRRTLYGAVSRHNLDPVLRLFDFPDPNLTNDRRAITTVPLQQLFTLNSEFIVRQARALASRVTAAGTGDEASRIRTAFLLVYGRPAKAQEIALGKRFLGVAAVADRADRAPLSAWEEYAQVLLTTNEFLFVD